jgi:RNA polymerase-binding transcription factor DksA
VDLVKQKRALLAKGRELAELLSALLAGKKVRVEDLISGTPGETPEEKLRRYLALVDGKITAIAAGAYGRCDKCGNPIPDVELEQLPWAESCRACG